MKTYYILKAKKVKKVKATAEVLELPLYYQLRDIILSKFYNHICLAFLNLKDYIRRETVKTV